MDYSGWLLLLVILLPVFAIHYYFWPSKNRTRSDGGGSTYVFHDSGDGDGDGGD